jgi:Acetyltransferases, including N-acetylases of ribosomal proteins
MAEPARTPLRVEGAGFVLRPWRIDDLDALLEHADDAEVVRGLSDRFPHPYTRADGEAFLSGRVVDLSAAWAIELEGRACGGIGLLLQQGERAHVARLGYWLGRRHWGHGHMSRIVGAFLDAAVPAFGLQRVEAFVLDGNEVSARVLAKNGFQPEGTTRAAVCKDGRFHDLHWFARLWGRAASGY